MVKIIYPSTQDSPEQRFAKRVVNSIADVFPPNEFDVRQADSNRNIRISPGRTREYALFISIPSQIRDILKPGQAIDIDSSEPQYHHRGVIVAQRIESILEEEIGPDYEEVKLHTKYEDSEIPKE